MTTSSTDLAIQGNGFFVVQNSSGASLLTRAGSFTQNSAGTLVNAAGFTLMGEPITAGSNTTADISGVDQLVPVTINPVSLVANPTTTGTLVANLDFIGCRHPRRRPPCGCFAFGEHYRLDLY